MNNKKKDKEKHPTTAKCSQAGDFSFVDRKVIN
jgi:hypothetical protein